MNPEKAWQTVLMQLQLDMPRASFDTWVRDTRLVSFENGTMEIGARNAYARDWLESRLTSTVARLLVGIMNANVEVRFVVDARDDPAIEDATGSDDEDDSGDDQLHVEVARPDTRYAEEVQPDRHVAPYVYAFRLIWFGDVSPKAFSLWISFRQAVYFLWKRDGKNIRNIPWQDVCRYANMGRSSFYAEIAALDLPGLVERIEINKDRMHYKDSKGRFRQQANLYRVHMDPPLARADAVELFKVLQERSGITTGMPVEQRIDRALAAINSLESESVVDFLAKLPEGNVPLPEIQHCPGRTAVQVVQALVASESELPAVLKQAAEALHQRIISFAGTTYITLYFLERAARHYQLTHAQIWLIAQLREKSFKDDATGEVRDWVIVRGGYRALARWAGVSPKRKTVYEWLRSGNFPVFVEEIKPTLDESELQSDAKLREDAERLLKEWDETDTRVFGVRLDEPLVDEAVRNPDTAGTQAGLAEYADRTLGRYGTRTSDGTQAGLGGYGVRHHFKLFKVLRPVLKDQASSTTPFDPEKFASRDEWVAALAPQRWNLQRLFKNAHVSTEKQKELAGASPEAFVSWLLYAFSQDSIKMPLNYALSQLSLSPGSGAGGACDELASYPPFKLLRLAAATENGSEAAWRRMVSNESTGDPLWDDLLGGFNPRIADLFNILTGVEHPSPGKRSGSKTVRVVYRDGPE